MASNYDGGKNVRAKILFYHFVQSGNEVKCTRVTQVFNTPIFQHRT